MQVWLTWLLFESPLALGILLFVVVFALLVHWRRTGRPRAFLVGLVLAAALMGVQAAVVTQREHADRVMRVVELAVRSGRVEPLARSLSAGFYAADMDRDAFVELTRAFMNEVRVRTLTRSPRTIELTDSRSDRFTVRIGYFAIVESRDFDRPLPSSWSITFSRESNAWTISEIEPITVNHRAVKWRELRGGVRR